MGFATLHAVLLVLSRSNCVLGPQLDVFSLSIPQDQHFDALFHYNPL